MAWGRGQAEREAAPVAMADSGGGGRVLEKERGAGGPALGWAAARSGVARFFKYVPRKKIRRKINKNPKKIKQIFPV